MQPQSHTYQLSNKLDPTSKSLRTNWQVGERLGIWTRGQFDSREYPYCPTHITRPKEERRLYLVPLPSKCFFAVPKHLKLLAVPLYELYDNQQRYGPVIASIPMLLSRYQISYAEATVAKPAQPAQVPAGGIEPTVAQQQAEEKGRKEEEVSAAAAKDGDDADGQAPASG